MNTYIHLKFWRFWCFGIYKIRLIKHFTRAFNLLSGCFYLLQIYSFLTKFDLPYFIDRGPKFFMVLYSSSCAFSGSLIQNTEEHVNVLIAKWDFDKVSKANLRKIIQELIYLTTRVTMLLVVIQIFNVLLICFQDEMLFAPQLIREYFPNLARIGIYAHYVFAPFIVYFVITVPSLYLHCFDSLLRIESIFFLPFIKSISGKSDEKVTERLILCIKRHVQLRSSLINISKTCQYLIWLLEPLTIAAFVSFTISYFSGQTSNPTFKYILFGTVISSLVNGYYIFTNGQAVQDFSLLIYEALCELDWYNWNVRNKRMYRVFLLNASQLVKLKLSEKFSINNECGLKILQSCISIVYAAYSLQNKNN